MEKDYVFEQIKQKVSKDTKVNQLEVDKAIDATFRGLKYFMEQDVVRVKVPHLGTFRKKRNLKEDGGHNGRPVHIGERCSSTKPSSEVS